MYKLFYAYGIGGKIKSKPEDFKVEEISRQLKPGNSFAVCTLIKKNWNTIDAVRAIASSLNIDSKRVGYAGIKDKNALTSQKISIRGIKPEQLNNVKINNIEIKDISASCEKVYPGNLYGNRFIITIRDFNSSKEKILKFIDETSKKGIANYFGVQRFSKANNRIGEEIIKGNFENAIKYMLSSYLDEKQKEFLENNWLKWDEIIKVYPKNLKIETKVLKALIKSPKDFSAALRKINKKILKLFVNSFQSQVFNEALEMFLTKNYIQKEIEIPGFGSEIKTSEVIDVMKKHKLKTDDFIIKKMQDLSEEGAKRNSLFFPENFKLLEFNRKFLKINFELPKGCYATVLLDELAKKC